MSFDAPNLGCNLLAISEAENNPTDIAANMAGSGATIRIIHAAPGLTTPETSRNVEYTADISVLSDGLTAIKKGLSKVMCLVLCGFGLSEDVCMMFNNGVCFGVYKRAS